MLALQLPALLPGMNQTLKLQGSQPPPNSSIPHLHRSSPFPSRQLGHPDALPCTQVMAELPGEQKGLFPRAIAGTAIKASTLHGQEGRAIGSGDSATATPVSWSTHTSSYTCSHQPFAQRRSNSSHRCHREPLSQGRDRGHALSLGLLTLTRTLLFS